MLQNSARSGAAPVLLVAGLSVRALAEAARRAGFDVIGFDAFGDEDARAACLETVVVENAMGGFASVDVEALLRPYASGAVGLVYGAGFDDCPERLAAFGGPTKVLGTPPDALARTKDPRGFAHACKQAGLAHPEIAFAPPPDPSRWLVKRRGGSGGAHIREDARWLRENEYAQRHLKGRAISLLFVRDAEALTPIAWSEQWTAPTPEAPYRWGGAAGLAEGTPAALPALARLTAALGVRGLASADFLDDGERLWLLEINPRPGATLDLFDDAADPLLARHVAACEGRATPPPAPREAHACAIVYAEGDCIAPPLRWPSWAADRPAAGARIPKGAPICTVTAADRPSVDARAAEMRQAFQERGHG